MKRRKILHAIGASTLAIPLAGCNSASDEAAGSNQSNNSTSVKSDSGTNTEVADSTNTQPATVFQNITLQNGEFIIDVNPEANVSRVNLLDENGTAKGGKPLPAGATQVRVGSFETVNQNVTFAAVDGNREVVKKVTKEYGPQLSFNDLRQPALDDENAGIPGEGSRIAGENPYTTLVVDVTNSGNVPFTASGISVVSGVPQPGDASTVGKEFTIKPGQTKTIQADDDENSVIAAWGGSWGDEGAPEGACQGGAKDAKLVVVSDNGEQITKEFKLVYRGGVYTMKESQGFETCGRIHSTGYRPKRPDLNKQEEENEATTTMQDEAL